MSTVAGDRQIARTNAVTAMFDAHSARDAFLVRRVLEAPWSIRVQDRATVTMVAVVAGEAWLVREPDQQRLLRAGDVVVVQGPRPYTLCDDPRTAPRVVIDPGQRCRGVDGTDLSASMFRGPRTWGDGSAGDTVLLTGVYERATQLTGRLLASLPPVVVLRGDEGDAPLVAVLHREMHREVPGQDAVLDRLVDLLLVSCVREWLAQPGSPAPPWWAGQPDDVIGSALALMHDAPERPWSVSSLATEVGVSRATFARRFLDVVGQPPMAYLTDCRLESAARHLRSTDRTVASVATRVGYANPFALSVAFKRRFGMSPQKFRDGEGLSSGMDHHVPERPRGGAGRDPGQERG